MKTYLLNIDNNAKTSKNGKLGYLTGILYMYPNAKTCSQAENAQCSAWLHGTCLVNSGYALIYESVNEGRKRKTDLFYENQSLFLEQLVSDIDKLIKKAKKLDKKPLIRLNGTTDIPWEYIKVKNDKNIFELYPHVQFYDYTKIAYRLKHNIPNYDLTFSYSSADAFQLQVKKAIEFNSRIAVVFRKKLPEIFLGKRVVNGDETDLRFLDDKNVVVGLIAKGKARKIISPFIVEVD